MTETARKTALVVGGALLGVMSTLIVATPPQPSRAAQTADQVRDLQQRTYDETVRQLVGPPGVAGTDSVTAEQVQRAVVMYLDGSSKEQP